MEMSAWTTCNYGTQQRQTTGRQRWLKLWVTGINRGEGAGQKWAGHKTVEEKKKEKWAHSVLAEESVVSCRAAELARFTNTWRFGAFANKTHTHTHRPREGFGRFITSPPFMAICVSPIILWSLSRTPISQSGCRGQCAHSASEKLAPACDSMSDYCYTDPAAIWKEGDLE